jgi:hypothetical protein
MFIFCLIYSCTHFFTLQVSGEREKLVTHSLKNKQIRWPIFSCQLMTGNVTEVREFGSTRGIIKNCQCEVRTKACVHLILRVSQGGNFCALIFCGGLGHNMCDSECARDAAALIYYKTHLLWEERRKKNAFNLIVCVPTICQQNEREWILSASVFFFFFFQWHWPIF